LHRFLINKNGIFRRMIRKQNKVGLPEQIVIGGSRLIEYQVFYSRRRSISITISPLSGVIVRAPERTPARRINDLLLAKSGWILKHIDKHKESINIDNDKLFQNEGYVFYRGQKVNIILNASESVNVKMAGDSLVISLKNVSDKEKAFRIFEKWFREQAVLIAERKLRELLDRLSPYNFEVSGFVVKSLKRRWGSCTSKGKITISSELIKLEDVYLEYVMIHELCHLRHHNHGKEFYRLLTELFPGWKLRRAELKSYIR
jgi:predicted metal-dependent hydrolase